MVSLSRNADFKSFRQNYTKAKDSLLHTAKASFLFRALYTAILDKWDPLRSLSVSEKQSVKSDMGQWNHVLFWSMPKKRRRLSLPFKIWNLSWIHGPYADAGMLLGIWGFLADEYNMAKVLLGCKEKPEKNKDVLSLVTYCGVRMLF